VSVEEAFAKVVGRQASDGERTRLYRLRDALGLRDNDVFWSIVMALEHYDSFFRAYPEKLAEETARSIENARAAFAVAAEKEAAQVQRVLSEKVAETCARALRDDMTSVHRLARMLSLAAPASDAAADGARVIPLGRYLRPAQSFALRRGGEGGGNT
jgi:hypothetical protein